MGGTPEFIGFCTDWYDLLPPAHYPCTAGVSQPGQNDKAMNGG